MAGKRLPLHLDVINRNEIAVKTLDRGSMDFH
jgi:hypothetical protein